MPEVFVVPMVGVMAVAEAAVFVVSTKVVVEVLVVVTSIVGVVIGVES